MKLLAFLKKEFLEMLPSTMFFFVGFCLLTLTRNLLAAQFGMPWTSMAGAAVGALVVGKAVLISDQIPWLKRLADRPLVYAIGWKALLYFLVASVLHLLEEFLPFLRHYGHFAEARAHFLAEVKWPHVWFIHMWLSLLLLVFCFARELTRAIGRERVIALLIEPPRPLPAPRAVPPRRRAKRK